jgi:hypothetical protein
LAPFILLVFAALLATPAFAEQVQQLNHDTWLKFIVYIKTDALTLAGFVVDAKGEAVVPYEPLATAKQAVAFVTGQGEDGKQRCVESKVEIIAVDPARHLALVKVDAGKLTLTAVEANDGSTLKDNDEVSPVMVYRVPTELMDEARQEQYGRGPITGIVGRARARWSKPKEEGKKPELTYYEEPTVGHKVPLPKGSEESQVRLIFDGAGKALGFIVRVQGKYGVSPAVPAAELKKNEFAYKGAQPALLNLHAAQGPVKYEVAEYGIDVTPKKIALVDGGVAVILADSGAIALYDTKEAKKTKDCEEMSPASDFALVGTEAYVAPVNETSVKVFDLASGKLLRKHDLPAVQCVGLCSPEGAKGALYLLCKDGDGQRRTIYRLDAATGEARLVRQLSYAECDTIRVDREQKYAYVGQSAMGGVRVTVDLKDLSEKHPEGGETSPISLSPFDNRIACGASIFAKRGDDSSVYGVLALENKGKEPLATLENRALFHPALPVILGLVGTNRDDIYPGRRGAAFHSTR